MLEPRYRYVKSASDQGVLVLTITQPLLLDEDVIDGLRRDLLDALEYHQANKVILNFQHVKYLASTAFLPLITLHRRLHERRGRLVLCGLSSMAAEVFHITGLVSTETDPGAPFTSEADLAAARARLVRGDASDPAA